VEFAEINGGKWGERVFSNQQLNRRVSIRIVMIMELD